MMLSPAVTTFRVGHLFCGIGAGAKGFNDANPRVRGVAARFECAGGVDVDPGAIRNFNRLTGAKGTVLDLFDRQMYTDFHGKEPPAGWTEAMPIDIRRAHGDAPLDVMFLSAPCKGFSGLLSEKASGTVKYRALNRLTVRSVWLTLEAYKDDPVSIIIFENVPRIETRGRALLDEIKQLLRAYGYTFVAETKHNCGEIGNLAQSRNRFLLVARHPAKVPPFLYEPEKTPMRGVGEVIGLLPMPGDPVAGPLHRVPELEWKTWVRLAFVPAGKDWRALNDLAVENGHLRDFGIVPDMGMRDNQLGVLGWDETAPTITTARSPGQGRFSVADPRPDGLHNCALGVATLDEPAGTIRGRSGPTNGTYSVADPRPGYGESTHPNVLGVKGWEDTAGTVTSNARPSGGANAVADPRPPAGANATYEQYGVNGWRDTTGTVNGNRSGPGGGTHSVADPRIPGKPRFNNVFRIVPFDEPSPAVAGPGGPAGGVAVADPRADGGFGGAGKYRVTEYDEPAGTVIAGSTTGQGAFALADPNPHYGEGTHENILSVVGFEQTAKSVTGASHVAGGALSVADPRPTHGPNAHQNKHKVVAYGDPSPVITTSDRVGSGALSVADPRPVALNHPDRDVYHGQGHYGVVGWDETSNAVPGYAKYDRGSWSVADPRDGPGEPIERLPSPKDRLVARIIARDGTWHRPFTTLDLAALQSLFDPTLVFECHNGVWRMAQEFVLEGGSDQLKREWIGNAVPSAAARGMAETIGETLLLAKLGETFMLSSRAIWVKPLALALSVDPRQEIFGEAVG